MGALIDTPARDLAPDRGVEAIGGYFFLNDGSAGGYRGSLRAMLQDAANGQLVPRIQRDVSGRAANIYSRSRTGVDLMKLYLGRSAEELDPEDQDFSRQVVKVGGRQRITQGLSPIEEE